MPVWQEGIGQVRRQGTSRTPSKCIHTYSHTCSLKASDACRTVLCALKRSSYHAAS